MRIPSWLGADPPLHSEAVYIGADRPTITRSCLHSGDGPYINPMFNVGPTLVQGSRALRLKHSSLSPTSFR